MTDPNNDSQESHAAGSHIETIEPSGATDDIRYVLHQPDDVNADKPGRLDRLAAPLPESQGAAPAPVTSSGIADQVIDNVDAELPDTTQSTISGGQVANESKRGAY